MFSVRYISFFISSKINKKSEKLLYFPEKYDIIYFG